MPRRTAVALLVLASLFARAHGDSTGAPIPRVETGGHTGFIAKLAVDQAGKLILTVSEDKTARLWNAQSGRLEHVLRVPIASGYEGELSAAALSPNGRIAAIGGYTGSLQGQSMVYFFDTTTGRRRSQQSTFADKAIENLAFSFDGSILAVCLADGGGVRIYSLQKRSLIKSETRIRDKILGAAFAHDGDLAVTTLDGDLWLFRAAKNYESSMVHLTAGHRPMHVQFSPNDSELAVGFDAEPTYCLMDAKTLSESFVGMLPPAMGQRGLHVVEWSADGEKLYAGGETVAGFEAPIYRFAQRGRGPAEKVLTSTRRISDIRRLPQGAMAFSSGEPEVGVVEASGRVRWRFRSATMDLRRTAADVHLSPSANSIVFGTADHRSAFEFDVLQPIESVFKRRTAPTGNVAPAQADAPGWNITVSDDKEELSINGTKATLDRRETVRCWTLTADGNGLLVGTSWSLRRFDRQARLPWAVPVASGVNLLSRSDDGHAVVAGLADGTLRWHRPEDGHEFLALFANRNGQDWIAWIPSGYYMSSVSGDNFIGWQINRGADRDPDFYRAVQFERILYRPELVRSYFKSRGRELRADANAQTSAFDIANLDQIAPPRLELAASDLPARDGQSVAKVSIHGESLNLPLKDWSLFVNGIPASASQALEPSEQRVFDRNLSVPLADGINQIRVESTNGRALGIAEMTVESKGAVAPAAGDLYIAAIGASHFADTGIRPLKFAAADAVSVAQAFQQIGAQGSFHAVRQLLLSDSSAQQATRSNILSALGGFLKDARVQDTVIVFLASHGLSDRNGNYFFVPLDARNADIQAVLAAADAAPSLLRWDYFIDQLRQTDGRRLLIVDTCSSAAVGGTFDAHTLAKRSMSSNFALMAASRGDEESQELTSAQHGLFTYGLLEALRTHYDPNNDGTVSLSEAFEFTFDKVQQLRNKAVGLQTPQLSAPDVLLEMALSRPPISAQPARVSARMAVGEQLASVRR